MIKGSDLYALWNAFVNLGEEKEENKSKGNPYHDPFTGQFTSAPGTGGIAGDAENIVKRANKIGLDGTEALGEASIKIAEKLGWKFDNNKGTLECELGRTTYSEAEDGGILGTPCYTKTDFNKMYSGKYSTKMHTENENIGKMGVKIPAEHRPNPDEKGVYGVVGIGLSNKARVIEREKVKEIRAKLPKQYQNYSDASIASLAGYDAVYSSYEKNGRYDIVNPKSIKIIEDYN